MAPHRSDARKAWLDRNRAEAIYSFSPINLEGSFDGTLVPQDDESASVLLDRIAAERAEPIAAAPKRGRKKQSA